MARHDEFPLLPTMGLYAAHINGDGNCLFNALSDQLIGDQTHHREIRARVIDYMRANASTFKQFIDVNPGGGVRRNPKRKNAGSYASSYDRVLPTEEEINRVFEAHLAQMAQGGTYGDNMEIVAFSEAYGVDVKIYQEDNALMVSGNRNNDGAVRPIMHIAYHTWEHYSSIRNIKGPHSGPPQVKSVIANVEGEDAAQNNLATPTPVIAPWKQNVVQKSLPFPADSGVIHRALLKCNGDVDAVVSELMAANERGDTPSTQSSSSVERDQDSEDEDIFSGPKKKQDRRMSRATRALKQKDDQHLQDLTHRPKTAQHPPMPSIKHEAHTSSPGHSQGSGEGVKDGNGAVDGPSISQPVPTRPVRLTLTQPKPQIFTDDNDHPESSRSRSDSRVRVGKTIQRQSSANPKPKIKLSASAKKDLKKAAQKAAAKERKKQQDSAAGNAKLGMVYIDPKDRKSSPTSGIKTLYI